MCCMSLPGLRNDQTACRVSCNYACRLAAADLSAATQQFVEPTWAHHQARSCELPRSLGAEFLHSRKIMLGVSAVPHLVQGQQAQEFCEPEAPSRSITGSILLHLHLMRHSRHPLALPHLADLLLIRRRGAQRCALLFEVILESRDGSTIACQARVLSPAGASCRRLAPSQSASPPASPPSAATCWLPPRASVASPIRHPGYGLQASRTGPAKLCGVRPVTAWVSSMCCGQVRHGCCDVVRASLLWLAYCTCSSLAKPSIALMCAHC